MPTTNHEFENPDYNGVDWHFAWYDNFERLDRYVEIRDDEANLENYVPIDGAKFFALDTGAVFIGQNDEWVPAPNTGGDPTFDSVTADSIQATTQFQLPEFGAFSDAPAEAGTVVWITGETDTRGLYRYDGTSYVRITGGGGDGGGLGGIGGYEEQTGDGTTQSFTWDTGISLGTDETIEWISVDAATIPASADFSRSVSGSEITVEYDTAPADTETLAWYWVAHNPSGEGGSGGGGGGASALSELTVDTDKNWQGFTITNVGAIEADSVSVANAPQEQTDVIRLSEFSDVDDDVTTLLGDVDALQVDKADDPHGNEAHSTDYAESGHNHIGDSLNPQEVTAASVSVSNEPSSPSHAVRQADLSEFLPTTGGSMSGDIDANGNRVRGASEVTGQVVEATEELHIPVHDGVPDDGNFYFRTDVDI